MKKIAAAVACLVTCVPLLAQQSASKPKVVKPKASPVTELSPVPAAAPVAEPAFAPVMFNKDVPVTAYSANDPVKVFDWVHTKLENIPGKPDQFSTSQEKQAYEQSLAAEFEKVGQIPIYGACQKKYDGDRQQYEIKASARPLSDTYGLKAVNAKALNLRITTLKGVNLKQESYTAQNGYGAETQVSKTTSDNYAIAYPYSQSPTSAIVSGVPRLTNLPLPYELDFGYIKFDVSMSSADARANDKDIWCLFVFSLAPPYVFKHTERSTPSRNLPFESITNYHAIFGRLDQVLVVNKATGELYDQVAR